MTHEIENQNWDFVIKELRRENDVSCEYQVIETLYALLMECLMGVRILLGTIPSDSTRVQVPVLCPTMAEKAQSGNTKRHPPDTNTAVQEFPNLSTVLSPTS